MRRSETAPYGMGLRQRPVRIPLSHMFASRMNSPIIRLLYKFVFNSCAICICSLYAYAPGCGLCHSLGYTLYGIARAYACCVEKATVFAHRFASCLRSEYRQGVLVCPTDASGVECRLNSGPLLC